MSHKSGHIIIRLALPHTDSESAESGDVESELHRGPCISMELPEGCSEDECAQLARHAYRRLTGE